MSILYDSLKKGHKVDITSEINQICREHLISNEWAYNQNDIENIRIKACGNHFIQQILKQDIYEQKDLIELNKVLEGKVVKGLGSFKYQTPTANQIYRYVEVCLMVDEKPKRIMENYKIWQETARLEERFKSILKEQ